MAMNATFRGTGYFDLVELFFEPVRVSAGKFDSAKHVPTAIEILLELAIGGKVPEQRNITDARFSAAVDFKSFRSLERTVHHWQIQLDTEPFGKIVAHEQLGD